MSIEIQFERPHEEPYDVQLRDGVTLREFLNESAGYSDAVLGVIVVHVNDFPMDDWDVVLTDYDRVTIQVPYVTGH